MSAGYSYEQPFPSLNAAEARFHTIAGQAVGVMFRFVSNCDYKFHPFGSWVRTAPGDADLDVSGNGPDRRQSH